MEAIDHKGRGRPKGSKNRKNISSELPLATEMVKEIKPDIIVPTSIEKDAVRFKSMSAVPKIGSFYAIKIKEKKGRHRILLSHLNFTESFPLNTRKVITKYGFVDAFSCPVIMRFVDIITDPETEQPIGVYHIISTPSMVRTRVDPSKIADKLTADEVDKELGEYLTHKALNYKMQRDLWRKEAETYKEQYNILSEQRLEMSQDIAANAIELLVNAITASKEMFEEIRKKNMPWYKRYMMEFLILGGIFAFIVLVASGAFRGG